MQKTTVLGLVLGFGGIIVGNIIEGGHTGSLIQFAAAVIVLSGTLGATLVANRGQEVKRGIALLRLAFNKGSEEQKKRLLEQFSEYAKIARRDSILALESKINSADNPFTKEVMRSIVDGLEPALVRDLFTKKIILEEDRDLSAVKIWTDAGGFAPTIGIIGAVLGLIHVMGNLSDTSKLGAGIAVAFVATVYGVGFANLLFLPIGSKLKKTVQEESLVKEMILEGAIAIQSGLSPSLVETKMKSYF